MRTLLEDVENVRRAKMYEGMGSAAQEVQQAVKVSVLKLLCAWKMKEYTKNKCLFFSWSGRVAVLEPVRMLSLPLPWKAREYPLLFLLLRLPLLLSVMPPGMSLHSFVHASVRSLYRLRTPL